jgi:RimJ/RimL family protein N-acetyltransferase
MPEGKRDPARLRPATRGDAELLLAWRNDPDTRAASFQQEPIELEEHLAWLDRRLADPGCALLVVELDDVPSGSVRLDREDGDVAEIHISLAPQARGRGLAQLALREASERAGELLSVGRVRARVKSRNDASLRAFDAAGFERIGEADGVIELSRPAGSSG